jgi:hypothetical protein
MTPLSPRLTLAHRFAQRVYNTHVLALREGVPAVLLASGVKAPSLPARRPSEPLASPRRVQATSARLDPRARLEPRTGFDARVDLGFDERATFDEGAPSEAPLEGSAEGFPDAQDSAPDFTDTPTVPALLETMRGVSDDNVAPAPRETPAVEARLEAGREATPRAPSPPTARVPVPTRAEPQGANTASTADTPLPSSRVLEALARGLAKSLAGVEPEWASTRGQASLEPAAPAPTQGLTRANPQPVQPLEPTADGEQRGTATQALAVGAAAEGRQPVGSEAQATSERARTSMDAPSRAPSAPEATVSEPVFPPTFAAPLEQAEIANLEATAVQVATQAAPEPVRADLTNAAVPDTASTTPKPAVQGLEAADQALEVAVTESGLEPATVPNVAAPETPAATVPVDAAPRAQPLTAQRALEVLRAQNPEVVERAPASNALPEGGSDQGGLPHRVPSAGALVEGDASPVRTAPASTAPAVTNADPFETPMDTRASTAPSDVNTPASNVQVQPSLPAATLESNALEADSGSVGGLETVELRAVAEPTGPATDSTGTAEPVEQVSGAAAQAQRSPLIPEVIAPDGKATVTDASAGPVTANSPVVNTPASATNTTATNAAALEPASDPTSANSATPPFGDSRGRIVEVYEARPPRNMPARPAPQKAAATQPEAPVTPARDHRSALRALAQTYDLGDLPGSAEDAGATSNDAEATDAPRSLGDWARALQRTYNPDPSADAPTRVAAKGSAEPLEARGARAPNDSTGPQAAGESQPMPEAGARNLRDWARALQNTYNPPEPEAISDPEPARAPRASNAVPARTATARNPALSADLDGVPARPRTPTFVAPRAQGSNAPQASVSSSGRTVTPTPTAAATSSLGPPSTGNPAASSPASPSSDASDRRNAPPNTDQPAPKRVELSPSARRFLQASVGVDAGDVPIITGDEVREFARGNRADAAALEGAVLLPDAENLESPQTLGLLAHELVHVSGERNARRFVAPKDTPGDEGGLGTSSAREGTGVPVLGRAPTWHTEEQRAQAAEQRVARLARTQPLSDQPLDGFQPGGIADPAAALEARWGGLPAPWQPLPSGLNPPTTADAEPGVVSLVGAGMNPAAWGNAATSAPPTAFSGAAAGAATSSASGSAGAQFAETGRGGESAGESGEPGGGGEQDIGALAQQVYAVLKRRLQNERNRGGR